LGRIFAYVCAVYSWTQEYLLNVLSIEQVFMYYDYAIDFNYNNAFMNAAAVWGKLEPRKKPGDNKPDKEGIKKAFGDKVKRPEGEGGPVVITG
jgi:hypothetical protein